MMEIASLIVNAIPSAIAAVVMLDGLNLSERGWRRNLRATLGTLAALIAVMAVVTAVLIGVGIMPADK